MTATDTFEVAWPAALSRRAAAAQAVADQLAGQLSLPASLQDAHQWLSVGYDLCRAEPRSLHRDGHILAAARHNRGLSQAQAARLIGVERGTVTRAELGQLRPGHSAYAKLRAALLA